MPSEPNEYMDRVEANSHRLMALGVQTAQRQSTNEYHLDQLTLKLDRLSDKVDRLSDTAEKVVVAVTANGENTRALARIAESHQRRIESLEGPRP